MRIWLWIVIAALALVLCAAAPAGKSEDTTSLAKKSDEGKKKSDEGASGSKGKGGGKVHIRITAYPSAFKNEWGCKGHTGYDIIKMVEKLKPDVINRFITGMKNGQSNVRVGPNDKPMKLVDFINAVQKAGAPGCRISAKIMLNKVWTNGYRVQSAEHLKKMHVTPPIELLDLDTYFNGGSKSEHRELLEKIKKMGFTLGFNCAGSVKKTYGTASYGLAAVVKGSWRPDTGSFGKMRAQGMKNIMVHIDYPQGINEFGKLTPDRQADVIFKKILPKQKKAGFRFIYPIIYSGYDSTKEVTKKNGPYKGASLFELMVKHLEKNRNGDGDEEDADEDASDEPEKESSKKQV